jgi:iron complex outermembrane recepter protein
MAKAKVMAVSIGSALAVGGVPTAAQTVLPEVVVSAPSPIVRAPRTATPPDAPAPAAPVEAAPVQDPRPIVADVFAPVTVIPSLEILKTPAASIGDVMFTQPGITSSTFAPGASRPVIRGLDNARVRVQENGIGSMDVSTLSEDHAVPIDPLTTDQLEIIRGPATLRWGPQAIGGVVAASNNRIPDPTTPLGIHGIMKGALTTVDNGREGAIAVDARSANVAVHADYFRRKTGDYRIPGGMQENTATDSWGASAGGSYIFQNGYFGVAVTRYESLYGIPGGEAAEDRVRIDLGQTKIMSRGEIRTHGSLIDTIRFWLGGTDYKHDERAFDGGVDTVKATFKNREVEGRTEIQFTPVPTAFGLRNTAFGVQAGHQKLGTSGEAGSLLAPSETTRAAGYLFTELAVTPTVRLQAAGRVGMANVEGTAALFPPDLLPDGNPVPEEQRRRRFFPASASLGALKELPWGVVASLTGSYAERAPEALELFAKGPHEASGTFEIGNPNLGKEAATSIEFGLRRPKGQLRFDFTAFHTRYKGFIYKRLTGVLCGEEFDTCGVETELKQVAFDQRDANFTGVELAAQLDVLPIAGGMFGVDGQYDFVRARFADGSNVPRIPPHRLGGGVFWRDSAWFARVGLLHAFAQNDIAAEETATPGYNLLKAEVSYTRQLRPNDLLRAITVGIIGTNLLNDEVRNHVSFKKDDVLLPGRSVRMFATLRW